MDYKLFCKMVEWSKWTLAQLRCEVRPTPELSAFMDECGLNDYEKFVTRYEREEARKAKRREYAHARHAAYTSCGMKRTPYGYE